MAGWRLPSRAFGRVAESARQALESVRLHRLRSALSASGIACAVASFVVLVCAAEGARRDTLERIGQLGMQSLVARPALLTTRQAAEATLRGSRGLSLDDAARLRHAVANVRSVGAVREVAGEVIVRAAGAAASLLAVNPDYLRQRRLDVVAGRLLADDDVHARAPVCLLGIEAAHRLGPAGTLGATVRIGDSLYRVVGIVRRPSGARPVPANARDLDRSILVPLGAEESFAGPSAGLSELILELGSEDQVMPALPAVRRILEQALRGSGGIEIVAPREILDQAQMAQRNFVLLTGTIAFVSLLAGGIGIMNTMLASLAERTREIGVRRAVGATRRHIALQFLGESVLLGAAGALAGLLAGVAAVLAMSVVAGSPVAITGKALLAPVLAALAAGLFFGIYPAARAARLDPVEALRHP